MVEGEQETQKGDETLVLNLTDAVQSLIHNASEPAGAGQHQDTGDRLQRLPRMASALAVRLTDQLASTSPPTAHQTQHSAHKPSTDPTSLLTTAGWLMQVAVERLSGKESAAEALEALTECARSVAQGLHAAATQQLQHTLSSPQTSSPTPSLTSEPQPTVSHPRSQTPAAASMDLPPSYAPQLIHTAVWHCVKMALGHKGISTSCHLSQHPHLLATWLDTQLATIHACMTVLSLPHAPHAAPFAPADSAHGINAANSTASRSDARPPHPLPAESSGSSSPQTGSAEPALGPVSSTAGLQHATQSWGAQPSTFAHLVMELWLCCKGVVGLRNPSPAVRSSAARVLVDVINLAEQQQQQQLGAHFSHSLPSRNASSTTLHASSSLPPPETQLAAGLGVGPPAPCAPGLPTLAVLQTLLCGLGLKDKDGGVRAAAVSAAAPLLARTFMQLSPLHLYAPTVAAATPAAAASTEAQTAAAPAPASTIAAAESGTASLLGSAWDADARTRATAAAHKNQMVALLSALLAALTDHQQPVREAAAHALSLCPSSMLHAPCTSTVPQVTHAPLCAGSTPITSHAMRVCADAAHHHNVIRHAPPSQPTSHHTADVCSASSSTTTAASSGATNSQSSQSQPNGMTGSVTSTSSTSWAASSSVAGGTAASCTSGSPSSGSTLSGSPPMAETGYAAGLCCPALDPRHPLVSWLLHCFASAPLHPQGPLCAFKEPGTMVRAVTALLQGLSDLNQHQHQQPDSSNKSVPQEHRTAIANGKAQLGNTKSAATLSSPPSTVAAAAAAAASDNSKRGLLRSLPMGGLAVAGVTFGTHAAWALQQQQKKLGKVQQGAGATREGGTYNGVAGKAWRDGRVELDASEVPGSSDGSADVDAEKEEEEETEDLPHGAEEVMDALPVFWEALGRVGQYSGSFGRAPDLQQDPAQASHPTPEGQNCVGMSQPLSSPQLLAQQLQQQQQQQQQPTTSQLAHPNTRSSSSSIGRSGPATAATAAISEQALVALEACVGVLVATNPSAGDHPWRPPPEASRSSIQSGRTTATLHDQAAVGGAVAWCSFPAAAAATAQLACSALPLITPSSSAESPSPTFDSKLCQQHHLQSNQHHLQSQYPSSSQRARTAQKLLALAEQLLDVTETPSYALYADEFGGIKPPHVGPHGTDPQSSPPQVDGRAREQQVGTAWVAQALAHIAGAALAGVHFPAGPTQSHHSSSNRLNTAHSLNGGVNGSSHQHTAAHSQNGSASSSSSSATHAADPHSDSMLGYGDSLRRHGGQEEDNHAPGQQQHPQEQHALERGPAEGAHSERHVLRSGLVVEVVDLSDTGPGSSSSWEGTPISVGSRKRTPKEGAMRDLHSHQQEREQNVQEVPRGMQQKSLSAQMQQQQQQQVEKEKRQSKVGDDAWEACSECDVEDRGRAVATRLLLFWAAHAPHSDLATPWTQTLLQQQCQPQHHNHQQHHHPQQHQQQLGAQMGSWPGNFQLTPPADPFPLILHALSSSLCLTTHTALSPSSSLLSSSASAAEHSGAWSSSKRTPSGSKTRTADELRRQAGSEAPAWASHSTMTAAEVQQQQLLETAVEVLVPDLRRVVAACPDLLAPQDNKSSNASPARSTWDRLLAARQAAMLALGVRHPYLSRTTPILLAAAVTTVHDPSPAVAVHGMHMLHHLATEGLAADLRWQSELLFGICTKLIVGCDESVWHVAAPTAVAMVLAIEATSDPRSVRCHALLNDLLFEVELGGHKASRRLLFLSPSVLLALMERLGLTAVRHLSRLLPLLLEWLHSYDAPSRAAASRGLCHLITDTWPRIPRHAPLLWQHLVVLVAKEVARAAAPLKTALNASSAPAAVASAQHRAEAEAAGVEVVADALAAAEAQLMKGPVVIGNSKNAASTFPASINAAAGVDNEYSRGAAGNFAAQHPVLVHALRACLLLAHCCSSSDAFRAAVADTEHTLQLAAGRAAAQHSAQRAVQQESSDANGQRSGGSAGGAQHVPGIQGDDVVPEGVMPAAQAASRAGLALLVHHVRAVGI